MENLCHAPLLAHGGCSQSLVSVLVLLMHQFNLSLYSPLCICLSEFPTPVIGLEPTLI